MYQTFDILDIKDFNSKFKYKLQRTDGYNLILFKNAKGSIRLDFYDHEVMNDTLFFIAKNRAIQTNLINTAGCVVYNVTFCIWTLERIK